jgi:pyrroloquinoline quinone (PQQ) biosynthesis protein C
MGQQKTIRLDRQNNEPLTRVWQKWRFSAPQTHLWLIKHWFSASTFVVKIATFAKRETVSTNCKKTADHQNTVDKNLSADRNIL